MTARRALALGVAFVLLTAPRAAADPQPLPTDHVRLTSGPGTLGILEKVYLLPQGTHVVAPLAWDKLDAEIRRLQDQEVRLTAENQHMRKRVDSWQPGWKTLSVATITGLVTGLILGLKL